VTSAEAVLVEEQSFTKLLDVLESITRQSQSEQIKEEVVVVMAISPNSRASLVQFLQGFLPPSSVKINQQALFLRLAAVLKSMGVYYVLDTSAVGDVCLVESRDEFLRRFTAVKGDFAHTEIQDSKALLVDDAASPLDTNNFQAGRDSETSIRKKASVRGITRTNPSWRRPATSTSLSATRINRYNRLTQNAASYSRQAISESVATDGSELLPTADTVGYAKKETPEFPVTLPVLSSHCPGFVCYAEKSQPEW